MGIIALLAVKLVILFNTYKVEKKLEDKMVSNQNGTDNNWNLNESRTLIQALIKDFYKNNLNSFADPIKQEGLIAAGKEISQIIILFNRLQKLINRNTPRKIWWDKIPRIIISKSAGKFISM
ncbi:hypothetical protein H6G97_36435 [Nostoc flagelliforme FACHB-838]|uniref:Uncharacterized protein n=1 Tax=Nostoc flagelliforme FACHB-838 TaxID=2692904 RepID=A0ABR8E0N8_9NOSO|nr:hypothetical protein [Nostoc flagelliforme]MBD2534671.1 hypothetical protein [Nostoc flagelliforme FACHB-838]